MEDSWKKYVVKHNDKSLKQVIGDVLGNNDRLSSGISTVALTDTWRSEFGPTISKYTDKLFFNSGKLIVYLTSAPLRTELTMQSEKIILRLNQALGMELIREIQFR